MTNQSTLHEFLLNVVAMEESSLHFTDVDAFFLKATDEDLADLETIYNIWNTSEDPLDQDLEEVESLVWSVADRM